MYTRWSVHRVKCTQIECTQGGVYTGWSVHRVECIQGGVYTGWSVHKMEYTQGGMYTRWSVVFLCVCFLICISSCLPSCVLWSLEFGARVFHDYLLIKFGGTEQVGWHSKNPGRNRPQ